MSTAHSADMTVEDRVKDQGERIGRLAGLLAQVLAARITNLDVHRKILIAQTDGDPA